MHPSSKIKLGDLEGMQINPPFVDQHLVQICSVYHANQTISSASNSNTT